MATLFETNHRNIIDGYLLLRETGSPSRDLGVMDGWPSRLHPQALIAIKPPGLREKLS